MVGPEDVDEDLEQEVTEECTKFGLVTKVVIYQERQHGTGAIVVKIFIMFQNHADAQKAQASMSGRYFGGRVIQADFVDEDKFLSDRFDEL